MNLFSLLIFSCGLVNIFSYHVANYGKLRQFSLGSKRTGKGKGFGKVVEPMEEKKSTPENLQSSSISAESSIPITDNSTSERLSSPTNPQDIDTIIENTDLFKNKAQIKELSIAEKIQQLKDEEALIATDPSVGAVPELVANRMLGRIVFFFGIPVFGGLAIFVAAFFASKQYDLTIPPAIIAYATQVPFIMGLVGISYAILSSSWDEEDGSMLGITEFKINIKRIQDGFARTKQNEKLKEEIEKESEYLNRRNSRLKK